MIIFSSSHQNMMIAKFTVIGLVLIRICLTAVVVKAGITLEGSERAVHRWANAHSHGSATRNFQQGGWYGGHSVLGMMVFETFAVDIVEIGDGLLPWSTFGERWKSFHLWTGWDSNKARYGASFPNFEVGQGVFGAVAVKKAYIHAKIQAPMEELDPWSDDLSFFRSIGQWAAEKYPGHCAYPTWITLPNSYQVVVFEKNACFFRDIPSPTVGFLENSPFLGFPLSQYHELVRAHSLAIERIADKIACPDDVLFEVDKIKLLNTYAEKYVRHELDESICFTHNGTHCSEIGALTDSETYIKYCPLLFLGIELERTSIHEMMHVAGARHPGDKPPRSSTSTCRNPAPAWYDQPLHRAECCMPGSTFSLFAGFPGLSLTGNQPVPPTTDCDECENDRVPPEFVEIPESHIVAQCESEVSPSPLQEPKMQDNCTPNPKLELEKKKIEMHPTCTNSFVEVRTWRASDDNNNDRQFVQVLQVQDTEPPAISFPPLDASAYECDNIPDTNVDVSDNCENVANAETVEEMENMVCPGTYTLRRIVTASDDCGNIATESLAIPVVDSTPPELSVLPSDITLECHDSVPTAAVVTASDNCDDAAGVVLTETYIPGNCKYNYQKTRLWTASDNCDNMSSGQQVITVQDTTSPVLEKVPEDVVAECDAVPEFSKDVTTVDNCDTSPTLEKTQTRSDGQCLWNYTLTREWEATDDCGNQGSDEQIVEVQDTTSPVLSGVPDDVTYECDAVKDPPTVTSTDNCDPSPLQTFDQTRIDGTCPSNYTLIRTWSSTDGCLNGVTDQQTVTVQDTTKPVISCNVYDLHPSDVNMKSPVVFQPTAVDNCDKSPIVNVDSFECLKSTGKEGNLREDKACKIELDGDTASVFISGGVGSTINLFVSSTDACNNVSSETCTISIVAKNDDLNSNVNVNANANVNDNASDKAKQPQQVGPSSKPGSARGGGGGSGGGNPGGGGGTGIEV